ncbi:hypothetical protein F2Q70_00020526 [Brassica cretica]|uniref:Transmembrane protein n=1 Tax=Brassica cretica TaxID=69181 RepID=A0A8S9GQ10_BRACR|nr:hypothetical protein F2Q70_00020526 [Brassica cretica]KAF2556817.1 hypothetical protein F2Q68_00014048 [Brassica cretica]
MVKQEEEDGKGIYGTNALSLSYWYGRGHEKRDLWMMLMFLVFAIAMRMPCLYSRCICVVSYHACRTRVSEKKDDEDQKLRLLKIKLNHHDEKRRETTLVFGNNKLALFLFSGLSLAVWFLNFFELFLQFTTVSF